MIFHFAGMGNSSLKAYERAIEIDPKHKLSLVNYGRQLKMMERYHEAESVYRRCVLLVSLFSALVNRVLVGLREVPPPLLNSLEILGRAVPFRRPRFLEMFPLLL